MIDNVWYSKLLVIVVDYLVSTGKEWVWPECLNHFPAACSAVDLSINWCCVVLFSLWWDLVIEKSSSSFWAVELKSNLAQQNSPKLPSKEADESGFFPRVNKCARSFHQGEDEEQRLLLIYHHLLDRKQVINSQNTSHSGSELVEGQAFHFRQGRTFGGLAR